MPVTYQLWARRDGVVAGTNITAWGEKNSLAAAEAASQSADIFTISVYRKAPVGGAAFAVPLIPGMQIYYVRIPLTGNPELVWAGRFKRQDETNDPSNFTGVIGLTCTTPLHELKTILERVTFNPTDYPTDVSRVNRLMVVAALPNWVSTGVTATASITFQQPPPTGLGEAVTQYDFKSIEEILNELRTDPGYPGDTGYPVPARTWSIRGELVTPATPADGVRWSLQYKAAANLLTSALAIPDNATYYITDNPRDPAGAGLVLLAGSSYTKDASEIIRSIHVAGPRPKPPPLLTWKNGTNVKRGHGQIRKLGGTNAWGDCGAISRQRVTDGDYRAISQTQELYLQHEVFHGPDLPVLIASGMKTAWEHITTVNTMGQVAHQGRSRLKVGLAQAVLPSGAAVCILRSNWIANRKGQQMIVRMQDALNYYKVQNMGTTYQFFRVVAGVATSLGTLSVGGVNTVPANGHEIKVSMIGDQFQVFTTVGLGLQVTSAQFNTAQKHGFGVDCDADATSWEAAFADLQITDFWGGRAFGLGNDTTVINKSDISYGWVFLDTGVAQATAAGVVLYTGDYTYNDWFEVSTVLQLNMVTHALERLVIWYEMPALGAEWIERHRLVTAQVVSKTNPWFVQFAAKDPGAALNNVSLQKMYANQFFAPVPPYSEVDGQWPANGMYQSDELDTFQKRRQHADAFFTMYAEGKETFSGRVRASTPGAVWAMRAPATVAVRSVQRGWVDDRPTAGTDKRKLLWLKSVRRVEVVDPDYPTWDITATSRDAEIDLQGPRHLQTARNKTRPPDNRIYEAQDVSVADNVTFTFADPTGDENFGKWLHVQVAPQGTDDWEDAHYPVLQYDPDVAKVTIPKGMLDPGKQYLMRYQTEDATGNSSGWSDQKSFSAPKQGAYQRPYGYWIGADNGAVALTAGVLSQEITFPEAGRILSYEIMSQDAASGVVIKLDVQKATLAGRRDTGVAAYVSIAGTDQPVLPGPVSAANYKDSTTLTGWSRQVAAGDKIRVEILGTPTPTARNVSLVVWVEREGTGV